MILLSLMLACSGDKDGIQKPTGDTGTTDSEDTGTYIEPDPTWWVSGQKGMIVSRSYASKASGTGYDHYAMFSDKISMVTMPWCRYGGTCLQELPTERDVFVQANAAATLPEKAQWAWNGNVIEIGSVDVPFNHNVVLGFTDYMETDASIPGDDDLNELPMSFEGEWGKWSGTLGVPESPGLLTPEAREPLARGIVDFTWTPGLKGEPYIRLLTNQGEQIMLLTDDGEHSIDTGNASGVGVWFGRWDVVEADVNGNDLTVILISEWGLGR